MQYENYDKKNIWGILGGIGAMKFQILLGRNNHSSNNCINYYKSSEARVYRKENFYIIFMTSLEIDNLQNNLANL